MADDLLDGVLGGEDDRSDIAAPEAPAGADAFAAAIAAIASRQDPQVAHDTSAFLKKQTELLGLQAQHLRDEHSSRLVHLRLTVAAAKRKRYADHMRNCLYTCIALLAVGIVIAAIRMTVEAMSDHGLVVENFTVPPDFAARGVTGQALAEDLAARVAAIRAAVNGVSFGQSETVRTDQSTALKVQIPETGISLDELERFLHRWLGHQTVVDGELRDEADSQVAILLHIAGTAPIEVRGPADQLDRLIQITAERAFDAFDPTNYVVYLFGSGREEQALSGAEDYARTHTATNLPPLERSQAYALLANTVFFATRDARRALATALVAIDIDPHFAFAWFNAALASENLGHDQATVDFYRGMLGTRLADQPASMRAGYARVIAEAHVYIDRAHRNWGALERDDQALAAIRAAAPADRYAQSAQAAAALHALARSRQDLARARVAGPADATVLAAQWSVSAAAADWPQALRDAQALVASATPAPTAPSGAAASASAPPSLSLLPAPLLHTQYQPWLAYAEAMNGDIAAATALIDQTPTDCYLCVRTRAKIAAAGGDAAGADRWFAEAVRQAPDLPAAYCEWGQALAARGDLTGAVRELSLAHEKGPHFADALKAWGDVLVKQGQRRAALAKYDEGLRDAPDWAALKQAREAAAAAAKQRA